MKGEYVTDKSTSAVAFAPATKTYFNIAGELTFVTAAGNVLCRKSYKGPYGYAVSEDGQRLALSQFKSVDLWHMEDLMRDCEAGR